MKLSSVAVFVSAVWALVGAERLPGVGDDGTMSSSPNPCASSLRPSGRGTTRTSAARETFEGLVQGAAVPNVGLREAEKGQFEDTPLEFIRLDLALAGAGASADSVTTWHQVAAAMLQTLVGSGYEAKTTEIVGNWIGEGLAAH